MEDNLMKGLLQRIWPVGLLLALCMLVLPSTMLAAEQKNDVYVNGLDTVEMARAANETVTIIDSGTCGENLTWTIDSAGTLTINGTGVMYDYSYSNNSSSAPWSAFCSEIKTINFENNVSGIGKYAFANCSYLACVNMIDTIETINEGAFYNCNSLKTIYIPYSVNWIKNSFGLCSALENIEVDQKNEMFCSIDGVLFDKTITKLIQYPAGKKGSYTISNNVKNIEEAAFSHCYGLTSIVIPEGIEIINDYTFNSCISLSKIEIPSSIKTIYDNVFYGCGNISDIYYTGTNTQWKNIDLGYNNESLISANIHYNSSMPSNVDNPLLLVMYLSDYQVETQQLFFNNTNLAYSLANNIEIYDVDSIDKLLGKYVLIKVDGNDIFKVVSIRPVKSKVGKLTNIVTGNGYLPVTSLYFDGNEDMSYAVVYNVVSLVSDSLLGKTLLYHYINGEINGFEVLQEKVGQLESYNSSTSKLTIAGVEYIVSNLTNISADDINNLLQKNVKIQYDQLNHLYAIEYFDENTTPVPSVDGFNLDIYRAKYLSDKSKNVSGYEYMEMKTPCSEFVSALQKTGFDEAVIAWKSFDLISGSIDDPTALYDFVAEPQDMYSAILLSLLEDSISYDIINSQFETYCKNTDKYISTIQNIIKAKYNMDICNNNVFYSLNAEQKELLYDTAKELYEKDFGDSINLVSDIFDGLTKGVEFVGNVEDYFERINTCLVVANTNEYMKQVLQEVYNESLKSENIYLQLAAMDCLEVITLSQDDLYEKLVVDGLTTIGEEAAKYVISDVVWPQIKTSIYASHPAVLVFQTAYKGSKLVSNLLFSTDKTYEAYLNMLVMNDITEVVDNAFGSLRQKFIDNETIQNANVLANAFDLAYTARDIDCQKAWQLVDVLDNTSVNNLWKLLGYNSFANAKEFCRIYQQSYYTVHKDALFGWIQYLYDDYPNSGLYEYYDKIYEEIVNKKCTKEFVAKCPIDVYVYDENNDIVAYIENEKVFGNDQIMLALVDDGKIIRFFDDINYRIEYVATDSGEMDITISEFDLNEDKVRTVNFYNVKLTDGQSYCFDVDNRILNDRPYELNISSTDEVVAYDFDSLLSSANEYNVSIQQGTLIDNGESFLNKKAKMNESFELYAYVPDGYSFVCWEASNGADIFEDKTASTTSFIMPEENIIIKAVIKANNISLQPVSSIALNRTAITLNSIGAKETLVATILPENANNKSVIWSSSNTSIVTVDENGVLTAVGNGTATITVTTVEGNYKATCEVKVSTNSSYGGNSASHSGGGSSSAGNKTANNNISVPNISNGGISITPKKPATGDTVTVNIVPDNGYELEHIKVIDGAENEVKITKVKENKYTFVMPEGKVKLDAAFRKIVATQVEETKVMLFTDIKVSDWFYNAVKFAYENNLMNGETDTLFKPNNNLNRAMLVTILYRLENTPTISEGNKFGDVASGQWYSNAVVWASANGIVNGYEDGTFLPMQNVSREEMSAMLMRYAKYKGYDVNKTADLNSYADRNKVSAWALSNMQWASGRGLIKGDENNKLNPQGSATRAEAAMILMRLLENHIH